MPFDALTRNVCNLCEGRELWVEKHAPMCAEDLVVHKKKVGEMRAWLQAQAAPGAVRGVPRLLFVTGALPGLRHGAADAAAQLPRLPSACIALTVSVCVPPRQVLPFTIES